jgi:murein L,D-transpeptidase YafK
MFPIFSRKAPGVDLAELPTVPVTRLGSLAATFAVGCFAITACGKTGLPSVDRVVVHKAQRTLLLMHGDKVERTYHVELGLNPIGQKEREGDSRTPEGTYSLEHNPHSNYFLAMKVSYPNNADVERARAHHLDPGGAIMIHGLPNVLKYAPQDYETHDWTDGCIALSNEDMAQIWTMTRDGVPIDILP